MIPWSLPTTHTISEIALQFLRGSYDGQHRPLLSIHTLILGFGRL